MDPVFIDGLAAEAGGGGGQPEKLTPVRRGGQLQRPVAWFLLVDHKGLLPQLFAVARTGPQEDVIDAVRKCQKTPNLPGGSLP